MICHLLSELLLFSSKLSHTKVPNINSVRQSHAFLPAIVRSQKSPEVSSSLTPQLPSFVDDWGTNQQSMFGRDRFRRGTKSENCRVYRVWGMWNVVGNFFLLSDSSDIVLFHYFFLTLWQTCWSLSFP